MRDANPTAQRIDLGALVLPALVAMLFVVMVLSAVAFDQGAMASLATDAMEPSGGALHELFHDARHLLGIPCH